MAYSLVRPISLAMIRAGTRSPLWGCIEAVAANFQDFQLVPVLGPFGVSNALENGDWAMELEMCEGLRLGTHLAARERVAVA